MDVLGRPPGAVRSRESRAWGASALPESIVWRIGGDQGEGIDSTGDVFATVASRLGYHVYTSKHFSSRIKGGHTHHTVRFGARQLHAPSPTVDVLVALTQETIDRSAADLVLADSAFKPHGGGRLLEVPMTALARDIGSPLYRNMVAVGASAAVLGLPLAAFSAYVEEKFARKGAETVARNLDALERGYRQIAADRLRLPDPQPGDRLLLTGNDAVALGAATAGCRLMAAYPITPATDIMETLATLLPQHGGAVCQMEDELAAITLAVGAGYAGARVLTATSGPGLSLMQEGIGLAAAAEIPLVVVDVQRAGPSTGMPTKSEQSDVMAAIFGGHGEGERIVLAPATPAQAFADAQAAFSLADRHQCPVILLSDLALGQFQQTAEAADFTVLPVDLGAIVREVAPDAPFLRHLITDDGISPRTLPGTPQGQYLATGVEHAPSGRVSEDPANRAAQVAKRLCKLAPLAERADAIQSQSADTMLVGFGSTMGAIWEAAETAPGIGWLQVRQLWPLPAGPIRAALANAGRILVVEQNATGELRQLLKIAGIQDARFGSLLHFDGTPLLPERILREVA
jgi:2-oxoglutarate ferredoxin oxidoreductase subunit alpha